jgi:hypothetical protein
MEQCLFAEAVAKYGANLVMRRMAPTSGAAQMAAAKRLIIHQKLEQHKLVGLVWTRGAGGRPDGVPQTSIGLAVRLPAVRAAVPGPADVRAATALARREASAEALGRRASSSAVLA